MSLSTLLDRGAGFDAEFAGGLSNHLPMALLALHGLGAPEARLEAFALRYAARLAPAPAAVQWPAGDAWTARLGEREAWPAYRSLFTQWIAWEGADAVLSQALPVLMPGCGAAAFHGLIRTACAVSSQHGGELADGLAYWACRFLHLGRPPVEGGEADLDTVLGRLQRLFAKRPFEQDLIYERMAAAAAVPAFARHVARLQVDTATLPALSLRAMSLYAQGGNFMALHLVTSCHALRLLLPWMDDEPAALRSYWVAYAAGFAARGPGAAVARAGGPAERTWDEIRSAAIASDDDHVIKLVYACQDEFAVSGDDACRQAAARAAFG